MEVMLNFLELMIVIFLFSDNEMMLIIKILRIENEYLKLM